MDKGGVYGVSTYEQPTKKAMDVYAAFRACYPRHGSYLAVGVDWAGDKIHLIIRHTQDNCVLFDKVLDKKGVQTDPDLHNVIDVALGVDQLDYAQYRGVINYAATSRCGMSLMRMFPTSTGTRLHNLSLPNDKGTPTYWVSLGRWVGCTRYVLPRVP
jgi:hypothetical protein